jgi:hypothetical protein
MRQSAWRAARFINDLSSISEIAASISPSDGILWRSAIAVAVMSSRRFRDVGAGSQQSALTISGLHPDVRRQRGRDRDTRGRDSIQSCPHRITSSGNPVHQ